MRVIRARRLAFAFLASLTFHLLLLWPGPARLPDKEAAPLQATLRKPPPAPAVPDAPAPSPPPRAVAPAPAVAPRPPVLATKPLDLPAPAPVPQAPAPAADPAPPPAAVAAPPAVTATTHAAAAASPSGTLLTQANASGDALDGLRAYRLSVANQARRFKRYPAQAIASRWEGTTEIRLEVGSDGRPRTAAVGRSSGHELLDRAALTMIDAGALRAPLPETLRGRNFVIVLPVVFNLEDE
jgi:protein TonB